MSSILIPTIYFIYISEKAVKHGAIREYKRSKPHVIFSFPILNLKLECSKNDNLLQHAYNLYVYYFTFFTFTIFLGIIVVAVIVVVFSACFLLLLLKILNIKSFHLFGIVVAAAVIRYFQQFE